jgi:E3 ubiquitin-protein ligase SHPRH
MTLLFVRTTKSSVQAELTIPAQTRYVFPIHLGKVERHVSSFVYLLTSNLICTFSCQVYDETFERVLAELGLDVRGVSQDGEVNTALLRTWLRKLRQICTHPQVGQLQKSGDRSYKPGVLKTMKQVLEGMKDQNWRNVIDDRRSRASFNLNFSFALC